MKRHRLNTIFTIATHQTYEQIKHGSTQASCTDIKSTTNKKQFHQAKYKHIKMAATRNTDHANVNNQSEFSEGDFEIELEDQSNMGDVPPPITITATTAEEQATPSQNPN